MKKYLLAIAAIVFIAGCDSGGSSSGSNVNVTDSNTSTPGEIGAQYAGTYNGTIEATYTATDLGLSDSASEPITIVIRSDGRVTVTVDGRSYSGTLDTDRITAVIEVNETYQDIRCTGTINVNAQISGNTISGQASGSGTCSQGSVTTPVRVAGTLNASR